LEYTICYKNGSYRIYDAKTKIWFVNGRKYRDAKDKISDPDKQYTLPAVYSSCENPQTNFPILYDYWYKNGKEHRDERDENGITLAAHQSASGTEKWYKNGKLYRDDKDEKGYSLPNDIFRNEFIPIERWYTDGILYRNEKDENGYFYIVHAMITVNLGVTKKEKLIDMI